jgi:hypothetical protein
MATEVLDGVSPTSAAEISWELRERRVGGSTKGRPTPRNALTELAPSRWLWYFVCMHNKTIDADTIIAALPTLDAEELGRVRAAVESMSRRSGGSTVLERRSYRYGLLQLEVRTYARRDSTVAQRGPYWYFKYREDGRQKTFYIGKTDNPEAVVDKKL